MAEERQLLAPVAAMAFYHSDGFVPAFKQVMRFAGPGGCLATMPDVIAARLATKPSDAPWSQYYTTASAEYVGHSRQGTRIIIVAHGVGPMATLDGVLAAYKHHYDDKTGKVTGGRITNEQFWELESGKFGPVHIVPLDDVLRRYKYPFIEQLSYTQALAEPLMRARLGSRSHEYLEYHRKWAQEYHRKQAGVDPENKYNLPGHEQFCDRRRRMHFRLGNPLSDPFILQMNCPEANYVHLASYLAQGFALAHLLSVGQLMNVRHSSEVDGVEGQYESLANDFGCHDWHDGTRLVGIRQGLPLNGIHSGPDTYGLLRRHWQKLMVPNGRPVQVGLRVLCQLTKEDWFAQTLKRGAEMDTCVPEFHVTDLVKVGEPVTFRTKICGYYGFVRYAMKEVQAIKPAEANLFDHLDDKIVSEGGNPAFHEITVQFYRGSVDTTQRILTSDKLERDFPLMMQLLDSELTV